MGAGLDPDDLGMIADALDRVLGDAPLEAIDHAGGQGEAADALWAILEENGYPSLCVGEAHGGADAGLCDISMLARLAARHALALPLVDTALARGLLSAAGAEPPTRRIALRDPTDPDLPVAHAVQCDAVLSLDNGRLRLLAMEAASLHPEHGAEDGAARFEDNVAAEIAGVAIPDWLTARSFHALAAFTRAAAMAGAMQGALDLTLAYTSEREQFGRPLSKFQAIQHHLADIACETAAASAAVEMAGDALAADPQIGAATFDDIAIAKVRCGEAAGRVAAAAHQAHGAMGFTYEYKLGRFTRRLWQWQDEFGSAQQWSQVIGNAVLDADDPALWPIISRPI